MTSYTPRIHDTNDDMVLCYLEYIFDINQIYDELMNEMDLMCYEDITLLIN
jgi:hypothetical protein